MNVLILTDFSDVAKNAGRYAMQFLAHSPVKFYLLNIGPFNPEQNAGDRAMERRESALERLNNRIAELKKISANKDHSFTGIYLESDLVTATRKLILEKKIDLIVMGAAKKGYSPQTIVGNHTYEVIKKIKCNLLAVAESSEYKPVEKMVLPMDPSAAVNNKTFQFFKNPGVVDKAGLTLMEIQEKLIADPGENEFKKESKKSLFSYLKNRKINFLKVKKADIYQREKLQDVQQKFDMIVLLGKNISICDKLLHTKNGIYSSVPNELPILVLHDTA